MSMALLTGTPQRTDCIWDLPLPLLAAKLEMYSFDSNLSNHQTGSTPQVTALKVNILSVVKFLFNLVNLPNTRTTTFGIENLTYLGQKM